MWTTKTNRDLKTEHTIRDVCARCNNGFLSRLDSYACQLFDEYFAKNPHRGDTVCFQADYHLLKRWLLKICFNSARINDANDCFVFQTILPYIRGESDRVGRSVQLFALLPFPSAIPAEHRPQGWAPERLFRPTANRIGRIFFFGVSGQKLLRAVHLRGFTFVLAFFEPDGRIADHEDFSHEFLQRFPHAQLLRPSRRSVNLVCDGVDAWSMFAEARTTKLV